MRGRQLQVCHETVTGLKLLVNLEGQSIYFATDCIYCGVLGKNVSLQHSGHYIYHLPNIQQFYVLPTQCIYVFCVDLRTNSDYFHIQH